MATSVATGRSTLVRAMCRASKNSSSSSSFGTKRFSVPLRPSNFLPHRTPISPPSLRYYSCFCIFLFFFFSSLPLWADANIYSLFEFLLAYKAGATWTELSSTRPLCNSFGLPCLEAPQRCQHLHRGYLAPLSLINIYACMCVLYIVVTWNVWRRLHFASVFLLVIIRNVFHNLMMHQH